MIRNRVRQSSAITGNSNAGPIGARVRVWPANTRAQEATIMSIASSRATIIALTLVTAVPFQGAAHAQLVDPNNKCVYQPGSTACQPFRPPVPAPATGNPYQQFMTLAQNSGIDLRLHLTYTEDYFTKRAYLFCDLLAQGAFAKVSQETSFPPVLNLREPPKDRPRLEVAIMRIGTQHFCPRNWPRQQQWEQTNIR